MGTKRFILTPMYTWHMGSRWHSHHHHSWHLAFWVHLGFILAQILVSSAQIQHTTPCLKLASPVNCLPARCLWHPNGQKHRTSNRDCKEGGPSPLSVNSITIHKASWQNGACHYCAKLWCCGIITQAFCNERPAVPSLMYHNTPQYLQHHHGHANPSSQRTKDKGPSLLLALPWNSLLG